jgi:hypothetical protein
MSRGTGPGARGGLAAALQAILAGYSYLGRRLWRVERP